MQDDTYEPVRPTINNNLPYAQMNEMSEDDSLMLGGSKGSNANGHVYYN